MAVLTVQFQTKFQAVCQRVQIFNSPSKHVPSPTLLCTIIVHNKAGILPFGSKWGLGGNFQSII